MSKYVLENPQDFGSSALADCERAPEAPVASSNGMSIDQRRDERFRPSATVELVTADGAIIPVVLTNISLNGFSARHASLLGVNCEISVKLDEETSRAARVVWVTRDALGCEMIEQLEEEQLARFLLLQF